jgi:hypothetical protein
VAAGGAAGPDVRLTHAGRLAAIARPEGDELKPYVVFAP